MPSDIPSIYIIGGGLYAPETITLEGLRCLRSVTHVFSFADVSGLNELIQGTQVVHSLLDSRIQYGSLRKTSYANVVTPILEMAKNDPPVAWVCSGNPGYIDGGATMITQRASEEGLRTRVIPGVSAIDTILCECNIRMPASSVQVYSASQMLAQNLVPSAALPSLVFQVARAETLLEIGSCQPRPNSLERLARRLAEAYGVDHEAVLVTTRRTSSDTTRLFSFQLGDLPKVHREINPWTSIFVPQDNSGETIVDPKVQAELESLEHMEQCYLTPIEMVAMQLINVKPS